MLVKHARPAAYCENQVPQALYPGIIKTKLKEYKGSSNRIFYYSMLLIYIKKKAVTLLCLLDRAYCLRLLKTEEPTIYSLQVLQLICGKLRKQSI